MKRALLCSAFAALLTGCGLCPSPPSAATGTAARYPITDVATAPATPVRNQAKSGTCWAFGGVSLIESEAIRTRRCTLDLSEMWVVRHAYFEKAVKYVRTRGRVAFDQGGEIQDVLWLVDRYGIVPQSLYEGGAADGTYDHASLAKAIRRLAKRIVDKKLYEKEHWQRMIDEELDRRLGARPDRFVIDGVAYTPFSYADSIGFRRDDYIALTSFTHHPFFERFVLEIPDNWAAHATLNIPLDSLMRQRSCGRLYGSMGRRCLGAGFRSTGRHRPAAAAGGTHHASRTGDRRGPAAPPADVRHAGHDRRPRHAHRRHGRRFARKQLLQGEKLLGRAGGTPRLLVCVARLCRRQNHRISTPPRRSGRRSRR